MGELSSMQVTVAGAGVFGLASALTLMRMGAKVVLADPGLQGANASAVAAGMLAPAFESALDPVSHGRFALLRRARDLWPAFLADFAPDALHRDGAEFRGTAEQQRALLDRLKAEGAQAEQTATGVATTDDWRVEPRRLLGDMRREFERLGGELSAVPAHHAPRADALVLACGFGARELAPELGRLAPIKGQLLRFAGGPRSGPILRSPAGYLAPSRTGAVVGATMEPGRDDLDVDDVATARLLDAAVALSPELAGVPFEAEVGVRAATPDGLPLVGPSLEAGVWLAAGARRNGWLLAPLVAEALAERLAGRRPSEAAAAMDSGRFET